MCANVDDTSFTVMEGRGRAPLDEELACDDLLTPTVGKVLFVNE